MNKSGKLREIPLSSNNTHRQRTPIDADATYRIGLCGFRIRGSRHLMPSLLECVEAAFKGANGRKLLLLPGQWKRRKPRKRWPSIREIARVATNEKLPIIFEAPERSSRTYTAVSDTGEQLPLKLHQQFWTGKNATPEAVEGLVKECNPKGKRAIDIAGLTVGLLICGENNVLTNRQSDNRGVRVRHSRARDLFRGVRLIFNGAHTKMGNWGKLEWRFRFLSKHKRWFFYATNNNDKREKWGKSTLCVYYNRRRIATSAGLEPRGTAKQEVNGKIKWEDVHLRGEKDRISLALVTSKDDRCIILAVDIPGKLLQ